MAGAHFRIVALIASGATEVIMRPIMDYSYKARALIAGFVGGRAFAYWALALPEGAGGLP